MSSMGGRVLLPKSLLLDINWGLTLTYVIIIAYVTGVLLCSRQSNNFVKNITY
uniref:Uncharacterized protein n=1 Tax=Arundo donax TaxID=35708 RepID=A0A0A9AVR2_ARUDO